VTEITNYSRCFEEVTRNEECIVAVN
jgi:hypothetical protein